MFRRALTKQLNQGGHVGELDQDEARAIGWIQKASRPVSAFEDASVVCDVLDALAGSPHLPSTSRGGAGCCTAPLGYAVRKKRLDKNPLSKPNLPEDWTPPQAPRRLPAPTSSPPR